MKPAEPLTVVILKHDGTPADPEYIRARVIAVHARAIGLARRNELEATPKSDAS